MNKSTAEIKSYWDSFSSTFSSGFSMTTTSPYYSFIHYLHLSSANVIIETGCGPGTNIDLLLPYCNPSVRILASDISESMISLAQSKNIRNTTFITADGENLPYSDETADRYISAFTLHIVSNPAKMLAEAFRVLSHGGIAAVTVPTKGNPASFSTIIEKGIRASGVESRAIEFAHIDSEEVLRKMIKDAGFAKVFVCRMTTGIPCLQINGIMMMVPGSPYAAEVKSQSEEAHERFLKRVEEEIAGVIENEGICVFEFFVAIAFKD
jgi:ubiquinone/menaquinone biosynthesis C-methylase UbiE